MRRVWVVFCLVIFLLGCSSKAGSVEPGLLLRQKIKQGNGCSFDAIITADYGKVIYTFKLICQSDALGNLSFTVAEPDSIAGVQGVIKDESGSLTFDDHVLAFEMLADNQITPICAPWLFLKSVLSGYIRSCENKSDLIHLVIDDSFKEAELQVDLYLKKDNIPVQADIMWNGKRIICLRVENFTIL